MGEAVKRRLPFDHVRIDEDDVPIVEAKTGRTKGGYGSGGYNLPGKIVIDPRQSYIHMVSCVFDEAVHEMWRRSQLRDAKFADATEEWIVHELAPFIREFIINNPAWVEAAWATRGRGHEAVQ
jgi:hypothetical protein